MARRVAFTSCRPGPGATGIIPGPAHALARGAWVPALAIWHAEGRFTRIEGAPCTDYAAALAASWRLRVA